MDTQAGLYQFQNVHFVQLFRQNITHTSILILELLMFSFACLCCKILVTTKMYKLFVFICLIVCLQVYVFIHEVVNLLMDRSDSDSNLFDVNPLTQFLSDHLVALQSWLCRDNYIQLVTTLYAFIAQVHVFSCYSMVIVTDWQTYWQITLVNILTNIRLTLVDTFAAGR